MHLSDPAPKHQHQTDAKKDFADDFCSHVICFSFLVLVFCETIKGTGNQSSEILEICFAMPEPENPKRSMRPAKMEREALQRLTNIRRHDIRASLAELGPPSSLSFFRLVE
jgi:hypothetical protein